MVGSLGVGIAFILRAHLAKPNEAERKKTYVKYGNKYAIKRYLKMQWMDLPALSGRSGAVELTHEDVFGDQVKDDFFRSFLGRFRDFDGS